ncbi:hypothetical protein CO154_00625 [Candidatus Pacearchaeota archaeon CG_4_9_14_3_um_filter_31_7]|nr:MAG: hypothetical protein AUJ10_03400 [Candidatus Pacearchaeota archaeon CG1_02_31_27]PIN92453.1 MAG: hypothetical protein COU55_01465 [Candidatus Pacearchaeota archaeon CG10_big_fil_rev_8_21_14_0_10_31_59]PIZ81038.1 MAG: hypothetical protein COX99_01165 [Candidatus Pacearchaeota archaeon CG_4_10_14_0_2_um_filter_31_10]PJA70870.1 MAG: hypothetical protein CO154_00625 [Candidatus Pacearchaeota archaeon CG_4_9_14_3_um_filter_31_7]
MKEEAIKYSFEKVKKDISFLNDRIVNLEEKFIELVDSVCNIIENQRERDSLIKENLNFIFDKQSFLEKEFLEFKNLFLNNIGDISRKLDNIDKKIGEKNTSTVPNRISRETKEFSQNKPISIGNKGVPAIRQQSDNNQTTVQQPKIEKIQSNKENIQEDDISKITDRIKEKYEQSFKKLTQQELNIFYILYDLQTKDIPVDYKLLAEESKLTQSSIRDYVSRLIDKGIPVEKKRLNNQKILLKIKKGFKELITIDSILKQLNEKSKEQYNLEKTNNL